MRRDRLEGLQSLLSCAPTECMQFVWTMRGSCAVATRQCGDWIRSKSKSDKCGATEWKDFKACFHAVQQSSCGVSGRCEAVVRSRRDSVGSGSGQSRKSDKCGVSRVEGLQSLLSCAATERMRCVWTMRGSSAVATRQCGDWLGSESKK
jgi:hypothetical protein